MNKCRRFKITNNARRQDDLFSAEKPWGSIKNKAGADSADVYIYNYIGADFWTEGVKAKELVKELAALDVKTINLHINSPGGSVFDGFAIYNALKAHAAQVNTFIDGLAASIASVIALAGDNVYMASNAFFMIHNPTGFATGDADTMRRMADTLDKVKESIMGSYMDRTGKTTEDIAALMDAETWLNAEEAKAGGFVDEVTDEVDLAACAQFDLTAFQNAPRMKAARKNRPAAQTGKDGQDAGTVAAQVIDVTRNAPQGQTRSVTMFKCKHCGKEHAEGEICNCAGSLAEIRNSSTTKERDRISKIQAMAIRQKGRVDQGKLDKLTNEFIDSGGSPEEYGVALLDELGTKPVNLEMSAGEQKQYSVIRAINIAAGVEKGDSFEMDVHQEIAAKLGRNSKGIFVPLSLHVRNASSPVTTEASPQGGALVATRLMPMIELLRARMMVKQMGARVISGLTSNVTFPKHTAGAGLSWTGENPGSDVGDSTPTFGTVSLSPKSAMANVPYTRQMLQQSSEDMENIVREDLLIANALGLDLASISGTGASNQPTGILNTTGIGSVAGGDNGLAPTWSHIAKLEEEVAVDNADIGALGYLTNPKVRRQLKETPKFTNTGFPIWEKGSEMGFGEMNGYRAGATTQVPSNLTKGTSDGVCSAIIFGNWGDLLIGEFGVIEIIADPFTLKKQGIIEVTSIMMVDIAVRHAESFAAMKDALT
jgi:HK97 family phage major capsid protein/ATP-dependent Clp endopeptidase proteolytic subunit ClpP